MEFSYTIFLHSQLVSAGIPIDGVAYNAETNEVLRIDFQKNASKEQQDTAWEIVGKALKDPVGSQEAWDTAEAERFTSEKSKGVIDLLIEKGIITREEFNTVL